ncbi:MAG: hypothetical protein AMXMBFR64_09070 [Myxococcales bacterium]
MLQALLVPGAVAVLLVGCGQPGAGAPAQVDPAPVMAVPAARDASAVVLEPPPITDVRRTVEELFTLAADAPVTVLDVTERSGLLRLLIQIGTDEPRTQVVWASRDGQYVADGLVEVEARREQLLADRRFATCLLEQGVRVFVNPSDGASAAQLTQLGAFARRLAVDCTVGPGNCDALGIKELPTFAVGDSRSPGLRTRGWIESRTGCK